MDKNEIKNNIKIGKLVLFILYNVKSNISEEYYFDCLYMKKEFQDYQASPENPVR